MDFIIVLGIFYRRQARNLFTELMRNLSTRTKSDGNALTSVVERFITEARKETRVVDYNSSTLHLANLTPEELYVLLGNLRHVFAFGAPGKYLVPDEALSAFLQHCSKKIGDAYFRTPRNTIKAFFDLLAVLEQNEKSQWHQLIETVDVENILKGPKNTPTQLANYIPNTIIEKHDPVLPKEIREIGYGVRCFDIDGAWKCLQRTLSHRGDTPFV